MPEEQTTSTFEHIRQDPGRVWLATMREEMAKLQRIRELTLPDDLFPGIARKETTLRTDFPDLLTSRRRQPSLFEGLEDAD